jgi:hypothetical protein
MGYQVTEDTAASIFQDPTRTPPSLQTPQHKARLLADLTSKKRSERSVAVAQLAGWDPDPEVADALRGLLSSDDEFTRMGGGVGTRTAAGDRHPR